MPWPGWRRAVPQRRACQACCIWSTVSSPRQPPWFRQARGRSAGREWRFQPALALLLAGDFTAASREYEVGLLRASDTDIYDA